MNPAVLNGVLRLAGFACLVAGAGLRLGTWAGLLVAGALLLIAAAPPIRFRLRGDTE